METDKPPEKLALERAAAALGGQAAVAKVIGYTDRRNVWPWFNTSRPFPADYCPALERETRRVAAERRDPSLIVTCEQLRPDVAWEVLRDKPADAAAEAGEEVSHVG